jgi:hypothetical protein
MPLVKLKSSATFLGIKRIKRTKIRKVIKLDQSPRKPVAHICASSGYPVNTITNNLLWWSCMTYSATINILLEGGQVEVRQWRMTMVADDDGGR